MLKEKKTVNQRMLWIHSISFFFYLPDWVTIKNLLVWMECKWLNNVMYVEREWGKVRIYLQKRCDRCWHKLTFTHMYKSQSHNITLQCSSLDCTYHFDMFTNRWTWGQWYMRSNEWVTSCFKWPSLKIHWPNMTLAVYQYFLLVSQVQISPLQN